jgi:hypothetical protein
VCFFFISARTRASGRRNLLALVQRFYEPTSWKGRAQALRHVVAGVPQEPFLFAASIRDNIAYGCDGGFRHFHDLILIECYSQFTVQSLAGRYVRAHLRGIAPEPLGEPRGIGR